MALRDSLLRIGRDFGRALLRTAGQEVRRRVGSGPGRVPQAPGRRPAGRGSVGRRGSGATTSRPTQGSYPGDFTGAGTVHYAPRSDGQPDPGEIVWAWVPYEEDHSRGKDRPVLVIGQREPWLLALMLTSKDHDVDARAQARQGREWIDVGTGDWDRQGRPSEVRVDRVLRLAPDAVRREGSRLDRARFDEVAAALRSRHGWR
jgi:hypothetical protein